MRRLALVLLFSAAACGGGSKGVTLTTTTYQLRFHGQYGQRLQGPLKLPKDRVQTGDREYVTGTFDVRRGNGWSAGGDYFELEETGVRFSDLDILTLRFYRHGESQGEVVLAHGRGFHDIDVVTRMPVVGGAGQYQAVTGELVERGGSHASEVLHLTRLTVR
jgi:hypothetical protein